MLAKTSLEQWAVLAAVVDQGGFAQAAVSLNRSQSAVSYSIARLQESLDLPLLVVEGRKSVLTPHGQTLLSRARGLLRELDTLEALARGLKQGWESELKLVVDAAFPRARLLEIVALLQISCPSTQVQLADVVSIRRRRCHCSGYGRPGGDQSSAGRLSRQLADGCQICRRSRRPIIRFSNSSAN